MWCDIDSMDVVVDVRPGQVACIQTDHRDEAAMMAREALSLVVLYLRLASPRLFCTTPPCSSVAASFAHEPPASFRRLAEAMRAEVTVGRTRPSLAPQLAPDWALASALVSRAAARLADETALREAVPLCVEGLRVLERRWLSSWPRREDDGEEHTRRFVSLAVLTGEVALRRNGGRWACPTSVETTSSALVLETVLDGAHAVANPFGKVHKFLADPQSDQPSSLAAVLTGEEPLMG